MTAIEITPETVARHELVGLDARVADAPNADLIGVAGRVVRETMRTLVLETDAGAEKVVPKAGTTFEFRLPNDDYATVRGDVLVARPARRTETAGGSTWRSD